MACAATAAAADMSIGDSPSDEEDCEEMGDDDDGRSIAEVATAGGLEIGGCLESIIVTQWSVFPEGKI